MQDTHPIQLLHPHTYMTIISDSYRRTNCTETFTLSSMVNKPTTSISSQYASRFTLIYKSKLLCHKYINSPKGQLLSPPPQKIHMYKQLRIKIQKSLPFIWPDYAFTFRFLRKF